MSLKHSISAVLREIVSICFRLFMYIERNRFIGGDRRLKIKKRRVNLYEYHPKQWGFYLQNGKDINLGDYLSFVIVGWMLDRKGISIDMMVQKTKQFHSVGSNIFTGFQNATIWGSGMITEPQNDLDQFFHRYPLRKLDIRAVRGPLTREAMIKYGHKCPEVYGDPAILMPLLYQPTIEEKTNEVLVIPQFAGEKNVRERFSDYPIVSMNTDDYKRVIDAIVSSKKVITSSLHGIILAEAYGVPAVYFKTLERNLKYKDYYYSTGRYDIKLAETFEDALKMPPPPIPNLAKMQQGLLDSFPYDLWK